MALLEVKHLTKNFGGLMANDHIDLELQEGEIVGLIGPNGAGKTTLFNCIAGFYPLTSGTVKFKGEDITGLPSNTICFKGIARTFQIVRVFKDLPVLDNVMVGAFNRTSSAGQARKKALEVLDFCGLMGKKAKLAGGLTIADKKRLEVAKAFATEPRLLMLDEAMAGLNQTETAEAVELVKKIRQAGTTILLVEHVMEVVMPISNRVVVLEYGKKIAEGMPDKVIHNEEVIKAYLGDKYHASRRAH
ncbi:MAG TPA: ABC transporter ATP-binding protein [Thermodesulfobacteriota bacterium]|nr:ABC transporter ATP-binding protein [Thermodesulfobacteriota bacterium]